jgi:hypothetical protein
MKKNIFTNIFYFIGFFLGSQIFLGYFFGVFQIFFIITNILSCQSISYFSTFSISAHIAFKALFDSSNSCSSYNL